MKINHGNMCCAVNLEANTLDEMQLDTDIETVDAKVVLR